MKVIELLSMLIAACDLMLQLLEYQRARRDGDEPFDTS
jgi:hypothetical protein